jgi:hypothetical protein
MSPSAPDPSVQPITSASRPRPWRARRPAPLVVAAFVVAVVLTACASAATIAPQAAGSDQSRSGAAGAANDGGALPAASAGPYQGAPSAAPSAAAAQHDALPDVNLIVRTGTMTVEVPSIDPALLRARTSIAGLGGYISASDQANEGDRTIASVTYRFPSGRWEDALAAIRDVATKVVSAKTDSAEVTGQVIDLGARIDNLRATEQALQVIMTKATKIPDILEVQNQLTEVQGQIEELSTQQAHLRDQASLATLTVLYQTPAIAVVNEVSTGWNPGAEIDQAAGQLLSIGQGLASVGIWFGIVGLPIFLATLIVLLLAATVGRRLYRRFARWASRYAASPGMVGPGV